MRRMHELHIGTFSGNALIDTNGNFVKQTPQYQFTCLCRADFNSAGRKVSDSEGSHMVYSFSIYTGKDCPNIDIGTLVKVVHEEETLYSGQVINFVRNRKNCVLWL
jgi:hypothetical protein